MPDSSAIILFLAASIAVLIVPGPTVTLVVTRSLSQGRLIALPLVLGIGLGGLVAASVSLAGAGALLATSAAAFTAVKLLGALYLIWLGIKLFRSKPSLLDVPVDAPSINAVDAFRDGFLVTVFNPKAILFFVAYVPQFIDPERHYATQAAFLVVTFVLMGMLNDMAWAIGTDRLRRIVRTTGILLVVNRAGGVLIAAAGVGALFARRSAV